MKKPECDRFLDPLLDEEIPGQDLREHLSTCSSCTGLRQATEELRSGPSPTASLQLSPAFLETLEQKLTARPIPKTGLAGTGKLLPAIAIAFLLSASVLFFTTRPPDSSPPKPAAPAHKEVALHKTNSLASSAEILHESETPESANRGIPAKIRSETAPKASSSPPSVAFPPLQLPSPTDDVE